MSKKMDLNGLKGRIISERKQGDIAKACRRVGVSDTVFKTAIRKDNYNDLTVSEEAVLLAILGILDERIENREKLTCNVDQ